MGDRATLDLLRGVGAEPDDATTLFEAKGLVPLFWFAMLAEADLDAWADRVGDALDRLDAEDGAGVGDGAVADWPSCVLTLPWHAARARLRGAVADAPGRMPHLAAPLAAFADALDALATARGATAVRLDLAEVENLCSDHHEFHGELLRGVRVWREASDPDAALPPPLRPPPPRVRGGWACLAGVPDDPVARALAAGWPPVEDDPPPPSSEAIRHAERAARRRGAAEEWLAVALAAPATIAAFVGGGSLAGPVGAWLAGATVLVGLSVGAGVLLARRGEARARRGRGPG